MYCVFVLVGCHSGVGRAYVSGRQVYVTPVVTHDVSQGGGVSHLAQCKRDLESLRTVDAVQHRRFLAEYDALMKSSEGFLTVKDDVSPEVAALARPRFQFALVNLCWRVKNTLAQSLINQAGGGR